MSNPSGTTALPDSWSRASILVAALTLVWSGFALRIDALQETATGPTPDESRAAVKRALPLLQASARTWTSAIRCFSCHHQGLGSLGVALARETGFEVDEAAAAAERDAVYAYSARRFEALLVGTGVGVFGRSTTLLALGAANRPRDHVTDSVAHFLAARQTPSGAWFSNEHRPPIEDSAVSATALTVRALLLYGPEGRGVEMQSRLARARDWLERVLPRDNEERCMRLMGLAWCGARGEVIDSAARELLEKQRDDGGWAQIDTLASDPYATGQALVVLQQAALVPVEDPDWLRGARYLLDSQYPDGSWHVETRRRTKGQPYVDSGFPYRKDQFISYAASTWATMALALRTASPGRTRAFFGPAPARAPVADAGGLSPLARAAAFGSRDEVCELLEAGALADERGPYGLTPLMLAVHDPAKVDTLLEAGADPSALSEWGFTPLLLAAMTGGAEQSVERLLARGVSVACQALNGATPLFAAANIGELGTLRALLDAGAEFTPSWLSKALVYAACCGDVTTGKALLDLGAEIDAIALQEHTALTSAAIAGYGEFVDLLIAAGADLEIRDEEGLTALAWASKIDPGHSRIVACLLRAGADVYSRSNDGYTPLDWSEEYANGEHSSVLRAAADQDP